MGPAGTSTVLKNGPLSLPELLAPQMIRASKAPISNLRQEAWSSLLRKEAGRSDTVELGGSSFCACCKSRDVRNTLDLLSNRVLIEKWVNSAQELA